MTLTTVFIDCIKNLEDHSKTLEGEADQLELGGDAFIGPERKPPGYVELDRNKPTLKKIDPSLKNKYADADKRKYEKKDGPSKDECKKFVFCNSATFPR